MMKNRAILLLLLTVSIVGFNSRCVDGATDQDDTSALNVLFTSLNSHPQLSQWKQSGGDPCGENWKGIKCSGSSVKEIKLTGLGLTGTVGYQLASLKSVTELDLSNNNIGGDIPYQLPPNLQRLNLANNQFTGNVQYSISLMTSLKYLNLAHNQLQGQLTDMFAKLKSLSTMDLSFNTLSGSLPSSFSSLTSMKSLYLQNNQFTGTIDVLAGLPLEDLNIGNNKFTGWIPETLKGINLQKDGNSFNSGPAPPPPPGTPPIKRRTHDSGSDKSPSSGESGSSSKSGISGGAIAGIIISLLVVGVLVAFFLFKRRKTRKPRHDVEKIDKQPFTQAPAEVPEKKLVHIASSFESTTLDDSISLNLRPPPADRHKSLGEEDFPKKPIGPKKVFKVPSNVKAYSIADLQIATNSFSIENLLGEGSFGRVYRAQFDDGKVHAVKKIDSSVIPSDRADDFTEMVSKISHLHNPNVTELVGYCAEHGQYLLIYEFHKNGSLQDFLHISDEPNKPLIWNSRVKIALGTARALEYLHEVCSPSIVHRNIKSANILLDSDLNPHLSDSGLATFVPNAEELLGLNDEGSGYSAPEVTMSGQYSLKSDVYSFGVVMLELLTGRKPFDSTRTRAEQSLVRWATPQLHDIDALEKMVDPALKRLYPVKSLSRFADVIALCVQPEPEFRPPMSEVVQALVMLVQRANMSKRTVGVDQAHRAGSGDANDYM